MRLFLVALVSVAFSGQACSEPRYQAIDFVGEWYFFDFDKNVDPKHSLTINKSKVGLEVHYVNRGKEYIGVFSISEKDRSITGNLGEYGRVVVRKVHATGELSLDQINEIEDIPIGFFQKKEVLEKLLKKKLP